VNSWIEVEENLEVVDVVVEEEIQSLETPQPSSTENDENDIPPELQKQKEVPFARYLNKELTQLETLKWKLRHQPNLVNHTRLYFT
jgi:hypothetical protein